MSNGEPVRWNASTANTAPKVAGTGSNRPTTAAAAPIAVIPVGLPGTVDQAAAMATWLRPAALAQ